MTIDALTMERTRDLQAEVGATLDRFYGVGLSARAIIDVLTAEAELWNMRLGREDKIQAAHERPPT